MTIAGKQFKAIAAMSENRVIGNGPDIPWHLPEDFKFFKTMTTGHVVVMGRTTFQAIGRPLPNRTTIIISRSGFQWPGVRTVASLDEIDLNADERDVFICGGAQVYALALPHCSDLYLTHVKRTAQGDVYFPPFETFFAPVATLRALPEFDIVHYQRVHA